MRLITNFDADGNIVSIITAPDGGLRPSIPDLPLQQRQVEIDAPDISAELDDVEIHRRLRNIMTQYKVDPDGPKFVAR
ncbi:hypothetical protein D8I24_2132 [Cupriavidus necator H850]|uniref:hypothetical protein n=1 Tax=Cupriavidus necator TaxID=106590 RepID=UPI00129EFC67|nr:hypothetical protein [Cupriavidus necator]KAI3606289.1 hypothetical protein D8I24_2132 [Cupriavidus necator H850]